jgi:hypothetical protein
MFKISLFCLSPLVLSDEDHFSFLRGMPQSLVQLAEGRSKSALAHTELNSNSNELREAETQWAESRRHTDSLLSKVHQTLASLRADLAKNEKEEQHELAELQHEKENELKQLVQTEKKLKDVAEVPKPAPFQFSSSFLETEKPFVPFENSVENANRFVADMKAKADEFKKMQGGLSIF